MSKTQALKKLNNLIDGYIISGKPVPARLYRLHRAMTR